MMRFWLSVALCLTAQIAQCGDWPQWRGPDRTDISQETGLLKEWPKDGPAKVWMNSDVGLGYSGMAVVGDTLYTMGAREDMEYVIAVNVKDGSQKWATPVSSRLANDWGNGPRGTPTVAGDMVYALSGTGSLICVAVADGREVWKVTMESLGGKTPNWGYTESVLVDGDRVVCTPGGAKGTVAALNRMSGSMVWQSADLTVGAQYASIIVAEHNGKRQYIQLTKEKLAGIDAANGNVLWTADWPGKTAVIPTPIFHDGHVYVSSGYGVGCMLVQLEADQKVKTVYENKTMKNHHGGVILIGKHLYGYSDGVGWLCQDWMTGETVWAEKSKVGKGSVTSADGRLYLFDEAKGDVALIEASPEGYKEHGRFTLAPQTTKRSDRGRIWTHPTVANGRLYLRDQELLFCFDIQAK